MSQATRRWSISLITAVVVVLAPGCGGAPDGAGDPADRQAGRSEPQTPSASGSATGTLPPADTPGAPGSHGSDERVLVRVGAATPILAEVADTDQERQRGLMDRVEVPEGTGMAFRYPAPARGAFWMFRTLVPLSIVWAADGRVVGVAEMTPCDSTDPARCERYTAPEPYDLAVETTGGVFTAADVKVGDPVVIEPAASATPSAG